MPDYQIEFDAEAVLRAINEGAHDGLASAARLIIDEMRRRAPEQTSQLAESIQRTPVEGSFVAGTLSVTFTAGAPYALYVEEGTRPHIIRPKNRATKTGRPPMLRWEGPGGYVFARIVHHPGTRAQPFFNAVVDENRDYIAQSLGDAIELAILKLGD